MSKRARNRAAVNREKARAQQERAEPIVRALMERIDRMAAHRKSYLDALEEVFAEQCARLKVER